MNPFDHTEIPESVTKAARYVSAYFLTRGVETWELMDICSRNHAEKLSRVEKVLATTVVLPESVSK